MANKICINLAVDQKRLLDEAKVVTGIPIAKIVRLGIDMWLEQHPLTVPDGDYLRFMNLDEMRAHSQRVAELSGGSPRRSEHIVNSAIRRVRARGGE